MPKTFKPNTILNATNSRITGIKIDRHGNIRQIRARIDFAPQPNEVLAYTPPSTTPMEQALVQAGI